MSANRLLPALLHLLQACVLLLLVVLPLAPAWLVFLTLILAPQLALGLGSSNDAKGLPVSWLRWRRLPYLVPLLIVVDFPLAFVLAVYIFIGFGLLVPAARVLHELCATTSHLIRSGGARLVQGERGHVRSAGTVDGMAAAAQRTTRASKTIELEAPPPPPPPPPPRLGSQASSLRRVAPKLKDGTRYRGHESVWEALEGEDVRLLSLAWLMDLADKGGVLPRRQELPDDAFLDTKRLKEIEANAKLRIDLGGFLKSCGDFLSGGGLSAVADIWASLFRRQRNVDNLLPIVSVSYCWLEAAHPDRDGHQLKLLYDKLQSLCGGRGLLGACRDYGFEDMGVFLDWGSGYQKDPALWKNWMADSVLYALTDEELRQVVVPDHERMLTERHAYEAMGDGTLYALPDDQLRKVANGERMVAERREYEASRSGDQKAAFNRMLHNTMDLWYAHSAITVVLLTQLPEELPATFDKERTYETRGWTTYERCSAELAKNFVFSAKWKLVIDIAEKGDGAHRRLPTTPEQMETLLADCRFTNGADLTTVLKLYMQTATAVLGTLEELCFIGLPLKRGDKRCSPSRLADALNYCVRLKTLNVTGTQLDDEGIADLAAGLEEGALPELQFFLLGASRFGAHGIRTLCNAFRSSCAAPGLQVLGLNCSLIGDAGSVALAEALDAGSLPRKLHLGLACCDIGDEGATALAAALLSTGCRIDCPGNRIGLASQSALLKALEATHGVAFVHMIALGLNGVLWPPAFSRALGRGVRRMQESGQVLAA